MAHHSGPQPGRLPAAFLEDFRKDAPLPSGRKWPEGRLDQSDDGEFRFGVTVTKGTIVLAFDRPVDWIGLTPEQASDLAAVLLNRSLEARGIKD